MGDIAVIVNPNSSGGRTGKGWAEIEAAITAKLGPVRVLTTQGQGDAITLTAQALREGAGHIIGVGGDGTMNEVVNGFFADDRGTPINPDAIFSFIMKGTGGDFRKSFGLGLETSEYLDRIATAEIRRLDIGKLTYTTPAGETAVRYFDNIASFGLSGRASYAVNTASWEKWFGGTFAFTWAVCTSFLMWRNKPVLIRIEDNEKLVHEGTHALNTAAICNGRYFGAGLLPGPKADLFDGLFDVTIIHDTNTLDALTSSGALKDGTILDHKRVLSARGRKVTATPQNTADKIWLDVDGETPGQLPATFEILPGALALKI